MAALAATSAFAQAARPVVSALKQMSIEQLLELEVVSVSRRPEKLSESASAIQVLTGAQIRRAGASNLPEALRLVGNLDVAQKNSRDWGISARGFNTELANKLLVMIDGRTVYTPLFSGVFWGNQDYLMEDIDRIEVISGPGGALWGANAVNGVINIISKPASQTVGSYLEVGAGTELRSFAAFRHGIALDDGGHLRVYAKHFERDSSVLANGAAANDAWHRTQGGFRFDSQPDGGPTFTLQGDVYRGHSRLLPGGRSYVAGGNLLTRWVRSAPDGSELRIQFYYDRAEFVQPLQPLELLPGVVAPGGRFGDELDTFDLDLQHGFTWAERHRIVWGAGYRFTHNEVANAPSIAFFPSELDRHEPSAFVQDTVTLRKGFAITLGAKVERQHYSGTEFQPSARFQWTFRPNHTLWGAVSRAARAPSRIDRDLVRGALPGFVQFHGGPDFDSEKPVAYELGWRGELDERATVAVSLFHHVYDDVRSATVTPVAIFPLFFQNGIEGEASGLEFSGTIQVLPRWRLRATYSLLREELRIKPGFIDVNNGLNEVSDPKHRFLLRSTWDLSERVEFAAGLRYVSERPGHIGGTPGTLPAYWEADARLGWRLRPDLELSVVGENLLHDQHAEYGFPTATLPEVERSIYAKLAWRF